MLNILLVDYDFYHRKGLSTLIYNQLAKKGKERVCFLLPSQNDNQGVVDIIFRNDMVTIYIEDKNKRCTTAETLEQSPGKITIHVPFTLRNQPLNVVSQKIKKIVEIASSDYRELANKEDVCWRLGLKQHTQLSDTENHVMVMIGHGYDSNHISKIMKRSKKTISTHYRNASRKIGMSNRAEFYRFASFIASCRREERNTICL
ncbi:helix-turn-helix domain-containing protein [Pantoea agglomerans]|uniref:Helix-turn-helix transcriptional regulator n=1 Tax=Enterobacter agglomerans TaxID=549 RepID=A0AAN2FEH1_ENTAG|nr:helix-turn-helix transcriptional regulator [Pantoea agglomerans]CAH6320573.1 helix-turn-helix transcriptional regulator [Pantoea agglomerans]